MYDRGKTRDDILDDFLNWLDIAEHAGDLPDHDRAILYIAIVRRTVKRAYAQLFQRFL